MEFFRIRRDIAFMRYAVFFNIFSLVTFLAALFFLFSRGLHLSIEFTSGTLIELEFSKNVDVPSIREVVQNVGCVDPQIQIFGNPRNVLVRVPIDSLKKENDSLNLANQSKEILNAVSQLDKHVFIKRVECVGSQVGTELLGNSLFALLSVVIGITIYLSLRFQWKYAIAGIIANLHDIVIILGFFALFQWEFSLSVLAGILAVLGYSVNESVVIFDRIRETFEKNLKMTVSEVIDHAITSTLSRTIITHGCTEMMVLSMLIFGGPSLYAFSIALTIGILFGVYSSVFVASSFAMWLGVKRKDLLKIGPAKTEIYEDLNMKF